MQISKRSAILVNYTSFDYSLTNEVFHNLTILIKLFELSNKLIKVLLRYFVCFNSSIGLSYSLISLILCQRSCFNQVLLSFNSFKFIPQRLKVPIIHLFNFFHDFLSKWNLTIMDSNLVVFWVLNSFNSRYHQSIYFELFNNSLGKIIDLLC